jgi:hypothetical protein
MIPESITVGINTRRKKSGLRLEAHKAEFNENR